MEKTVVLVCVLGLASWAVGVPDVGLLDNGFLGESDLVERGWEDIMDTIGAPNGLREEARSRFGIFRKALLPFLMGITLKAGSLVPVKLMIMTFIVVMSLIFAKLGLAVSALVGYLQYQEAHKKNLHEVTNKWLIPPATHEPSGPSREIPHHESITSAASEQQSATATAPVSIPPPSTEPNTKRFQQYQYDPYRYDPFNSFNHDPYRFTRYDYPH